MKTIFPEKGRSTEIPFHNLKQILADPFLADKTSFNKSVLVFHIDNRHMTTAAVDDKGALQFLEDVSPLPPTIHITDPNLFTFLAMILRPTESEPVISDLEIHKVRQQHRSTKRRQRKRKNSNPTLKDAPIPIHDSVDWRRSRQGKLQKDQQDTTLQCCKCSQKFAKEGYSNSQLKKKTKRRCKNCIDG